MPTVTRLQPSRLATQRQLLAHDLDITGLKLVHRGKASLPIHERVLDGEINRTVEGASTVSLTVWDQDKVLRKSGMLGSEVDIKIDGLWFRLVRVAKNGDNLTLMFEAREVAILRKYTGRKHVVWGKTTREWFIWNLIHEVKEFRIPLICPTLKTKKVPKTQDEFLDESVRVGQRETGFGARKDPGVGDKANDHNERLTIKGVKANSEQLSNIEKVLDVGTSMLVKRKLLVCSVMTVIQESTAYNLTFGDRDSVGMFQQRPSQGWPASRDIAKDARAFFESAIRYDQDHPQAEYWEVCQGVQRSAYPEAYRRWRTESERLVTAYGMPGYDFTTDKDVAEANLMSEWGENATQYQFSRGFPKQLPGNKQGWSKEDSWECMNRLADEINFRCFEVAGSIYFISEPQLFKSAPRARISEETDGIDRIDWDYDVAKPNAKVNVTGRASRWAAPPGSVIEIFNEGRVNGRWIVTEIRRNIFSTDVGITLKKPRPRLPEPKQASDLTGLWDNPVEAPASEGQSWANPWTNENVTAPGSKGTPLGDFTRPLRTQMPKVGGWYRDAEGAPDASGTKWHSAHDWFAPAGTVVFAPQDGEVVEVQPSKGSIGQVFGGVVKIRNNRGYVWVFRHVDADPNLSAGDMVSSGQPVARVSYWAGGSPHAHVELWKTLEGGYRKENMVDVVQYILDVEAGKPV